MEGVQSVAIRGVRLKANLYAVYGCACAKRYTTADDTCGQSKAVVLLITSIGIFRLSIIITFTVTLHAILIVGARLGCVVLVTVGCCDSRCSIYS